MNWTRISGAPEWIWLEGWGALEFGLLLLLAVACNLLLVRIGQRMAVSLTEQLKCEILGNLETQRLSTNLKDETLQEVLLSKFKDVNRRALHHLIMVRDFAAYVFMQGSMLLITSGVAAVSLLFLSRKGWKDEGSVPLLIVFAATAVCAAIYAALPRLFSVNDNIRTNRLVYSQLLQLSDQLKSFACVAGTENAESPARFLEKIDKALERSRTIEFAFDFSRAPSIGTIYSELTNAIGIRGTSQQDQGGGSENNGKKQEQKAPVEEKSDGRSDQDKENEETQTERGTGSGADVDKGRGAKEIAQQEPPGKEKEQESDDESAHSKDPQ